MKPRYEKARLTAFQLLASLRLHKPPVSPEHVAKSLGIRVVKIEATDPSLSGFMMRQSDNLAAPVIGVNKKHVETRRRFTIAHEIGHFLLHRWGDLRVDRAVISFRDERSSTAEFAEEIEANQFAAELLMPAQWVRREVDKRHLDLNDEEAVRELAGLFKVSAQAMSYRLANIGLT